jgi:tetratricopeptide (TPR) repeat protein
MNRAAAATRCQMFWTATWLVLVSACSHRPALPALPEVATGGFLPAIKEAMDAAAASAKAQPNDPNAVGRFGMLLHAHNQFAAAEQAYHRAELLDSTNRKADWTYYRGAVLLADGKAAQAAPLLEQAAQAKSNYLPALLKAGEAYATAGDAVQAERLYRNAVRAYPTDPSAHFGLGRVIRNQSEIEKALDLFPNYGAALFASSQAARRAGQTDRANELTIRYEKYKTTAPALNDPLLDAIAELNGGATALIRKAQVAAAHGDLQSAIDLHLKALERDPNMAQAFVNLISLYGRTNNPQKASEAYRSAIALNPNLAEAHYNYGVLLFSTQGDPNEAKALFEKTIAIDPAHAAAHHNLGGILQQQGNLAAAQREFEKSVEIDPASRNSRFQLGRLYANSGRNADAIAQFEKIVSIDDEMTPTYLYALAATTARVGDTVKARTLLASARQKAAARSQTRLVDSIDRDLARLKR